MIKIIKHYYVNQMTYDWVRTLAKWDTMSTGTYDLFVSLLTRSAWRYKINSHRGDLSPAYPLHNRWLRKIKADPKEIPEKLIGCDNTWLRPKDGQPGKCRYYWINNDVIRAFEVLIFSKSPHCINLYTGKSARKDRPLPTDIQEPSLYDKNRHLKTSELVADAIRCITKQKVKINFEEFHAHVLRLNAWFDKRYKLRIDNPTLGGRLVKNTRSGNYLIAHFAKFRAADGSNSINHYTPCYRPLYTGRITEQFIGLQSCSRPMRRKLLSGIDCTDFDLQNAQLNCLHYLLQPSDIKNMLAKTTSRIFADAASFGLPKKLVKPFLYAYIFNAGKLNYRISAVLALKNYCRNHKLLTNFSDWLAGLTPIKLATETLLLSIKQKTAPYINHAGVTLTEDALEKLALEKLNGYLRKKNTLLCFPRQTYLEHAKNKILLAFFIQGVETCIIHKLTINSSSDTYTVISNQHDGIIVTGNKDSVGEQMAKINKDMNANFVLAQKPL
jgi:hypothetical protein